MNGYLVLLCTSRDDIPLKFHASRRDVENDLTVPRDFAAACSVANECFQKWRGVTVGFQPVLYVELLQFIEGIPQYSSREIIANFEEEVL